RGFWIDQTGWGNSNRWTWRTDPWDVGISEALVAVRDGKHAGPNGFDVKKTASFALGSANRPPRVDVLFSDRPAPQYAGSWVRWTAIARDPEGDPLGRRTTAVQILSARASHPRLLDRPDRMGK
ncbi:MAG: hypothetical protein LUQ15_05700, partial [Methanothrix sp.]